MPTVYLSLKTVAMALVAKFPKHPPFCGPERPEKYIVDVAPDSIVEISIIRLHPSLVLVLSTRAVRLKQTG
jgi:hypothetical protein